MGSGGVAIAALPTVICLKVPFSDGLGGGERWRERESDWESPIPGAVAVRHGSSLGGEMERET